MQTSKIALALGGLAGIGIACGGIENDPNDVSSDLSPNNLLASFVGEANVETGDVTLTEVVPGGAVGHQRVYKNISATSGKLAAVVPTTAACVGYTKEFTFPLKAKNVTSPGVQLTDVVGNVNAVSADDKHAGLMDYSGSLGTITPTTFGYRAYGNIASGITAQQTYRFCVNGSTFTFGAQFWAAP